MSSRLLSQAMARSLSEKDGVLPSGVDLWLTCPADARQRGLLARYRELLTPDEEQRASSYAFEDHLEEFLTTRALVRTTLSAYGHLRPEEWRFASNDFGRPRVEPPCGIGFNLSNAPSLVACAVAGVGEVGVDLEPQSRAGDVFRVAETVFTEAELDELRALRQVDITQAKSRAVCLWTCKEAYIKARGRGLSLHPRRFSIRFSRDGAPHLETRTNEGRSWAFRTLDLFGHRVTVCHESSAREVAVRVFCTTPLSDEPVKQVAAYGDDRPPVSTRT